MDKLTRDFFNADFPGMSKVSISDNVFETLVPVVKLDYDIDTNYILDLCLQSEEQNLDLKPNNYNTKKQYQKEARRAGLECHNLLWNYGYPSTHMVDIYQKKLEVPPPIKHPNDTELKIREYFLGKSLDLRLLLNMALMPNSYLRPHRDISFNPNPLLYCWIPLTHPLGSECCFYPTGKIDIQLGSVYLFNQENFVHSVRNTNQQDIRYALIGHIDSQTITNEFKQQVTDAIQKQYLTNN